MFVDVRLYNKILWEKSKFIKHVLLNLFCIILDVLIIINIYIIICKNVFTWSTHVKKYFEYYKIYSDRNVEIQWK